MKQDIHPQYHTKAKVSCACGATMKTGSTQEEVSIEICSACHPIYTGKKSKVIDTAGRVERFEQLKKKAATLKNGSKPKAKKLKKQKVAADIKELKKITK